MRSWAIKAVLFAAIIFLVAALGSLADSAGFANQFRMGSSIVALGFFGFILIRGYLALIRRDWVPTVGGLALTFVGVVCCQALTLFALNSLLEFWPSLSLSAAALVLTDTAAKGLLFDFMESFELSISRIRPEQHVLTYQTAIFSFRLMWSALGGFLLFSLTRWIDQYLGDRRRSRSLH